MVMSKFRRALFYIGGIGHVLILFPMGLFICLAIVNHRYGAAIPVLALLFLSVWLAVAYFRRRRWARVSLLGLHSIALLVCFKPALNRTQARGVPDVEHFLTGLVFWALIPVFVCLVLGKNPERLSQS